MRSRATIPIHPTTVITSNESGAAALHFAEGVARTAEFARAITARALWNSDDDGRHSEEDSEQSLHGAIVDFCEERMLWRLIGAFGRREVWI